MFNFFKKKKKIENIGEVLKYLDNLEKKTEELEKEIKDLKEKGRFHFQKMGIVRFNPFSSTGGDQSFSVALLDENNNGVVITSIYSREGNRVYAKSIKEGTSEYALSEEEKEAIKKAIGSK